MQRARFLQGSGTLVVAFSLGASAFAQTSPQPIESKAPKPSEANPQGPTIYPDVDSWIAIDSSGDVTVSWGKVELGTGIETAMAQLVADELYVPLARVRVLQISTATPNQGYTAGSQSLTSGAIPVRQAAATARGMLIDLAAQRFGVGADTLNTSGGYVFVVTEPSRRAAYGDLLEGRRLSGRVASNAALRPQGAGRVSGTSVSRADIPPKLRGTYTYVHDFALPGMVHGRVIYPPRPDSKLEGYDDAALRGIPGARVVRRENFLAVIAPEEWHAIRAARALKVRWTPGTPLPPPAQLDAVVRATPGTDNVALESGNVDAAFASAAKTLSAEYAWPFQSHGSIGPSCAVADVRDGRATVWSPTQGVHPLRGALAELLKLQPNAVRVNYLEGSGCYGQNGADDCSAAAALISQAIGKPVRVQYMRADETAYDPKGPAMIMTVRAALAADGTIAAWDYRVRTPSHSRRPDNKSGNLLPGLLTGAPEAAISFVGGDRNAKNNYAIPAQRITIAQQHTAVLRQSALRGLGGTQNTFANESFIDELAHAAGDNPIDFRIKHLTDERAKAVLEALRGDYRSGRGVAFVRYENTQAYVAAVADVSVERGSGKIRVNHVWIAHDCGYIVNPDGLRNQIEGNVVQAASRALLEEVRFDTTRVTSVDWRTYPILRFADVPDVTIRLIDRPDQRITGAGEATTTVIAPAIANAVFAKSGVRLRSVPFTPATVRAALRVPQRSQRSATREISPAS